MERILGIDVGSRRIGVAVSDPLGSMALPLETVDGSRRKAAARRIAALAMEYEAETLVVGWPMEMSGREGRAARTVAGFIDELETALSAAGLAAKIERWDERLTTQAAQTLLIDADVSRSRRKDWVDQIAAAHILQGYLDAVRIEAARNERVEDDGES
jgi:putative holliday junction resolvase